MAKKIDFIGCVHKLNVSKKDIIVLKMPHKITTEQIDALKKILYENLLLTNKILVLEDGIDIGVLSQDN